MSKSKKAGFSLIEVIVSIALLGLLVVPISSGILMSHRINEKSDSILQARLAVSSAAEILMATGVDVLTKGYNPSNTENIARSDYLESVLENQFSVTVDIVSLRLQSNGGYEATIKSTNDVLVTIFARNRGGTTS